MSAAVRPPAAPPLQMLGPSLTTDPVGEARAAEAAGFHAVRVLDHLFCALPGGPENALDHPFVLLGAAAAATERVVLTQTVLDVTRRHPTEVAQAVATLDRISGGRAELGLGTGWYEREHDAVGLPLGPPARRVDRLVDALAVCRAMFDGDGRVDHDGPCYRAHVEVPWAPLPHRPDIVVGASRPVLLRRAAELADRIEILAPTSGPGADAPLDPDTLAARVDVVRTAAAAAGRADAVRLSARVVLALGATPDPADPLRLAGSPDDVAAGVERLAAFGFDRVTVLPADEAGARWLPTAVRRLSRTPDPTDRPDTDGAVPSLTTPRSA